MSNTKLAGKYERPKHQHQRQHQHQQQLSRQHLTWSIVVLGGGHHYAHRGNIYHWQGAALKDTGGDINVEAYRLTLTQVLRQLEWMGFTGHVILQTYSPSHFFYGDWDANGNCEGRTVAFLNVCGCCYRRFSWLMWMLIGYYDLVGMVGFGMVLRRGIRHIGVPIRAASAVAQ